MSVSSNLWAVYHSPEQSGQKYISQDTTRNQMPRAATIIWKNDILKSGYVLLDLGCGKYSHIFKDVCDNHGAIYNGIDPFNVPKNLNLKTIENCSGGRCDLVTISNVLNTIAEIEIHQHIVKQAYSALKTNGTLIITVYEGEPNTKEKQLARETNTKALLTPIVTRDGYQHRKKTNFYLPSVLPIFPNAKVINFGKNGGKAIVATKD